MTWLITTLGFFSLDSARDDEHRLIARYAAKLAQEARAGMVSTHFVVFSYCLCFQFWNLMCFSQYVCYLLILAPLCYL